MSLDWLNIYIHESWTGFLTAERRQELRTIAAKVGEHYDPPAPRVLRFLTTDLGKVRVVILGQDPYPRPGVATGRAFEVEGLNSWQDKFQQASLKNILRLLYRSYNNIETYGQIPPFTKIRQEIKRGAWPILPPRALFQSWEDQGALLLNTTFTVNKKPGGHRSLWKDFTLELLEYISQEGDELHWFLWGQQAQAFLPCISGGHVHSSRHPMLCSPSYGDDFLKSDCFNMTKQKINWLGCDIS